jgi:hypothetical protein
MSQFTTPLINEHIDGRLWKLAAPFEYHLGKYPVEFLSDIIRVPVGFIHDFASIPRLFWAILPPTGLYGKAAVIHDYLYRVQTYSRKRADLIFLEAMEVLNVPKWKRVIIYRAVRLCGWNAYRKRAKQSSK